MYYTYELIDPRDGSVFYVGKGKGDRRLAHEADARKGIVGPKCDRIREVIGAGLKISAVIVERFKDEADAYRAEIALIARYGIENLTNILPGGGALVAAPIDPRKQARSLVRKCWRQFRQVMIYKHKGIKVYFLGWEVISTSYDLAMETRRRAGSEYFDRCVLRVV